MGLCESIQFRPHQAVALLPQTLIQGRRNGLAQLRFAHAGGAVKDQRQRAQRLPLGDVAPQLEGRGLHSLVLAQYTGPKFPAEAAAQLALCAGIPVFGALAAVYRLIKSVRKKKMG